MEWWQAIPLAFVVSIVSIGMAVRTLARDRAADAEKLAEKLAALAERMAAPSRKVADEMTTLRSDVALRFAEVALADVVLGAKLDAIASSVAEMRRNLDVAADAGHGDLEALRVRLDKFEVRVRELEDWRQRRSPPSGPHPHASGESGGEGPRNRRRG